jgi:outer membrane protein assembly factor BamB
VITNATNRIRSYDLESGKLIWECTGMTRNVIPSPIYSEGIIYLMSGYRGNALMAISLLRAKGDVTGTDAILWSYDKNTPYTPNPILMNGLLYFLKTNNGYLTCLDAKDGTEYYANVRVEGINNIFTSPVGVKDRIYIVGTNGVISVVKAQKTFEVLAQNTLDDQFFASPVILGNNIYLRGVKALYCISGK